MSATLVGQRLRERARDLPGDTFWVVGDHRATYAEADASSDRLAAGLAELGVSKSDRVAVLSANRPEYLEAIFALAKLGAIQVPINAFLRGDFLQHQLHETETTFAIADGPGASVLRGIQGRVPSLKKVVTLESTDSVDLDIESVPYEEAIASTGEVPPLELSPADPVSIMYTSGTTGRSKGCILSHAYYMHMGSQLRSLLELREGDRFYVPLPLFHAYAQIISVMGTLNEGLSLVIEPQFSATATLDRWIETGATIFNGIGMMPVAMMQLAETERDRAHNVRTGLCVPLPPAIHDQFMARFGVDLHSNVYGQTESFPITLSSPSESKPGSIGRAAPLAEVAVVDDDDNPLPPGEVGEIVVRPRVPSGIYSGYWRQPEFTINTWRNLWHHTGDSGKRDSDGYFYFVDRKQDALRRRGENISSIEVETALMKHPMITHAAVVAVPSTMTEDEMLACIVPAEEADLEPEELFQFFKKELPYFVVPRFVRIISSLPMTPTLKVQKHILRAEGVTSETWDFESLGYRIDREQRRT